MCSTSESVFITISVVRSANSRNSHAKLICACDVVVVVKVVERQENDGFQLGQSELVQIARSSTPTKRILFTTTR